MDIQQTVKRMIDFYLSHMPIAGRYALQIQKDVLRHPPKAGMTNQFGAALTDADLSLQNFFEVLTLSEFPSVRFFGEEVDKSLNMKYFSEESELQVLVDPIDGTRYYADHLDVFNIIVSIVSRQGFEASIVYVPGRDACYYATNATGAFVTSTAELMQGISQRLTLSAESNTVITYDHPDVTEALSDTFSIIDVHEAYEPGRGCPSINSILWGEAAAVVCKGHGLIDWGAVACIVACAGGVVTSWSGAAVPTSADLESLHFDSIIIASNQTVHEQIQERLIDKVCR